jgi:hypothetical protein
MRDKYILTLVSVAGVIVLPAAAAHALGGSIRILASLASIQFCLLLAFLVTSLVSLILSIRALTEKKWKKAGLYGTAVAIPFAACYLAFITNGPGWEAVMGI